MAPTHARPLQYWDFRSFQHRATATYPVRRAANDTPSPSPTAIFKPPSSVAAVASVTSVVGAVILILLGFGLWRCRTNRRRAEKARVEEESSVEKRIDLNNVAIYMEKPRGILLDSNSPDLHPGWVPQIRSQRSEAMHTTTPEPTEKAKNKVKSRHIQLTLAPFEDSHDSGKGQSLLPSKPLAVANPLFLHIPPPPIMSITNLPTPPTPPIGTRKSQPKRSLPTQEVSQMTTPSPRSESFAVPDAKHEQYMSSNDSHDEQTLRLPRLMTAATAFSPTLADELSINVGDSVRMFEEYRDGWCAVQHVGKHDAPKGVVPRFCLYEQEMASHGSDT